MPTTREIDLGRFRGSKENLVLAGRDLGEEARRLARIDELDSSGDSVVVKVPVDYIAVTSSWILGAFGASIRSLGEVEFRRRFRFDGKPIQSVIDDAIEAVQLTQPLRQVERR
jgi:hypothetical protein